MFGVVLWSDEVEQKAVIWCEDHGDLAFYRNTGEGGEFTMDAGDWVQFDMTMERRQRFAHNPRLVHEGVYPDIAEALNAAPRAASPGAGRGRKPRGESLSARILPFTAARMARRDTAAEQAHRA